MKIQQTSTKAVHMMKSSNELDQLPSPKEMDEVFRLCKSNDWDTVLLRLQQKPAIGSTPMIMSNHISTTVIHQAITSSGDVKKRTSVIRFLLKTTPQVAAMKNGYGSIPLHQIAQRNTKMNAKTKEELMFELVAVYKEGLAEACGVGKRTPLHVVFTDYISPRLTQMMIDNGTEACFLKDQKGYLPAHVACSRHCSPEKLHMLLTVHPGALFEKTADGSTLLSLATSTKTKTHPNYALIDMLNREMERAKPTHQQMNRSPIPSSSPSASMFMQIAASVSQDPSSPIAYSSSDDFDSPIPSRGTIPSSHYKSGISSSRVPFRKRKFEQDVPSTGSSDRDPAKLLLHFSRGGSRPHKIEHVVGEIESV